MEPDRPFITVVSGLPRSGTSLLMQMLAAGGMPVLTDAARPPDADNPRGYYELAAVKATARDASWVDEAGGRAVKVIHALVAALPRDRPVRILFMRRAIEEVMRSQAAMLERMGRLAPGEDETLAKAMVAQLDRAVAEARGRAGCDVLELGYADLVANPAAGAARIAAFLGGGLDTAAMAAAVDPALYRQREI